MAGPSVNNQFGFHAPANAMPSMGFSSMGPPPPPQRAEPQTALRDEAPPQLPKLELDFSDIMSPKNTTGTFEISPFDDVMDHDEQLTEELEKASPDAKLEDILQALKPKKSFIFDRTQLAEAMAKPLPPLPGQQQQQQSEGLKAVDPRSPPLRGESGIVRSIDDILEH